MHDPEQSRCSSCAACSRCSPRMSSCSRRTVFHGAPRPLPGKAGRSSRRWSASCGRRWTWAASPMRSKRRCGASTASSSRTARCCRSPNEEIGELFHAANANWREVEPAIFGTLLEQALDPAERRGSARTTRRAPMSSGWSSRRSWSPARGLGHVSMPLPQRLNAARQCQGGARRACRNFTPSSAQTQVLDPACGTGNFLYVAMELMKRLEGEVLEAARRSRRAGGAEPRRPHRRPAPIPRHGDQSARRGDRRTGPLDRLSCNGIFASGAARRPNRS